MKKRIIGCVAFLFACTIVTINATAHAENFNSVICQVNDTMPPMHHQNKSDSNWNKNKMTNKNRMKHDSMQPMRMGDSTNSNSHMDSTHN